MDDSTAFLRTIFASPDDQFPVLVWADWLAEHGDDREEWVRDRRRRHPDELDRRAAKEVIRLNVPGRFVRDVCGAIAETAPREEPRGYGLLIAVRQTDLTFRQWLFIWIIASKYRNRIQDRQVLAQLQEWFP